MNISSRFIRLNGTFEIPEDLEIGREYVLSVNGSITDLKTSDEQDGTYSHQFNFKPSTGQIADTLGLSVKLVDKTRKSVKFRQLIERVWGDDYDQDMNILLAHSDEVKSLIEKYK